MKRMKGRERYRQKVYENLAAIRKGDIVTIAGETELLEVTSEAYRLMALGMSIWNA